MRDTRARQACARSGYGDRRFGAHRSGDDLAKLVEIVGCKCLGGLPGIAGCIVKVGGDRKRGERHVSKIIDRPQRVCGCAGPLLRNLERHHHPCADIKVARLDGVGGAALAIAVMASMGRMGAEESTVSASATPTTRNPSAVAIA